LGKPLGLLSVIPGNQTYFTIENTFSNLNFYEFVSDQYATLQWNHNFNGRIFPEFRLCKTQLERISIKVYGSISDENRAINASGLVYNAPEKDIGNTAGIGNIFKIFRIDFAWRANYLNVPETNRFTIKGSFDLTRSYSYAFQSFPLEKRKGFTLQTKFTELPLKIDIK
jgi:hypothetical protein